MASGRPRPQELIDIEHTFTFIDLAGFTALTEAHGDREAAELIEQFEHIVETTLDTGDRLVKTIGDAVMLVSATPRGGLLLVRRVADACSASDRFPAPRAGLHHGPAIERRGDYVGASVNLAARVTAQAIEGTAVLTSTVAPDAEQLGYVIRPLGHRQLRNIPIAVELWELELDTMPAITVTDPVRRMRVTEHQAVADVRHAGQKFSFCSFACLKSFVADPGLYAPFPTRE